MHFAVPFHSWLYWWIERQLTLFVLTGLLLIGLVQVSPVHWLSAHGKMPLESFDPFDVLMADHGLAVAAAAVEHPSKYFLVVVGIAVETGVETAVETAVGMVVETVAGMVVGMVAGLVVGPVVGEVGNPASVQMYSEPGFVVAVGGLSHTSDVVVEE